MRNALRLWIVILALGAGFPGVAGRAEAQALATAGNGLNAGHFILHPSITLEFTRDDNVFRREDSIGGGVIGSGIVVARARLVADLPLGDSRVRWAYSPVFRDYTSDNFVQSERFSHFFDLDGDFRLGPSMRLAIRDHLVRGTVELQEVDPGGELTFGLVPFTNHEPQMEITLGMAGRYNVSLLPRYSAISFEHSSEAPLIGTRTRGLEGRVNCRISEPSTLYAYYSSDSTTLSGLAATGSDSRRIGVGLRRMVNQAIAATFSAGFQSIEFEGGSGQRFSGPVLDASARWRIGDVTALEFGISRQPYQSYSVDRNYYVNRQIRLRVAQQIGRKVYWETGMTFHGNVYADAEDPGVEKRRDRTWRVEIGAGYHFLRTLRAVVGCNLDVRRSNIETPSSGVITSPLDYRARQIVFRIEAGWL